MTTTQTSPARVKATEFLIGRLTELHATQRELQIARDLFEERTGGRRPGYQAAADDVIAKIVADRTPAHAAAVKHLDKRETKAQLAAARKAEKAAETVKAREEKAAERAAAKAERDAAKPVKAPARQVERVSATPGAFLKQRRLARRTQTVVELFDATHADAPAAPWFKSFTEQGEGNKYAVLCVDHGFVVAVKSYEAAWKLGLRMDDRCTACADALAARPVSA